MVVCLGLLTLISRPKHKIYVKIMLYKIKLNVVIYIKINCIIVPPLTFIVNEDQKQRKQTR
jgi:hypothetical protein